MIAVIVGAVAIIAAIISITGLGIKVSSVILAISGGHVLLTLILAMVVSIILGMGLPTVAAYILTATSVFVQAGIPILAAHLFILYFAILSGVIPSVALAAYNRGRRGQEATFRSLEPWARGRFARSPRPRGGSAPTVAEAAS